MRFGAPDDDPSVGALDHVDVEIRVFLLRRPQAAVALDVGDADGAPEIVRLIVTEILQEAVIIRGAEVVLHGVGDDRQSTQEIDAPGGQAADR
jgi:hypothetical protein